MKNKVEAIKKPFFVDLMVRKDKYAFSSLVLFWFVAVCFLWSWWLQADHIITWWREIINSLILAWSTIIPGYCLYFFSRMKKINPELEIPEDWKVAMVVTRTPSEPFSLVKKTLKGMLAQKYPHDTWLADENPDQKVIEWCKENNVQISTRKDNPDYHRPSWPRKQRTKEGNLAYFYDHFGYKKYNFVVQMDADHVPEKGYLEEMIRPFIDKTVGYVSAPSVCDSNLKRSWSAKARAHSEAILYSPLNAGYNEGWATLCSGSHYAIRTEALKQIGGLGPELAEDFTTSLMLQAAGWKGVDALNAEAHGHGPQTFPDLIKQDYQWAKSLTKVLFCVAPKHYKGLSWKLRLQFTFSLFWFQLLGLTMLAGFLLPLVALMTKKPFVDVNYFAFLLHLLPVSLVYIFISLWLRKKGWVRPANAEVVSWQNMLFQFARWPWLLIASCDGLLESTCCEPRDYRVTPKNLYNPPADSHHVPFKIIIPYLFLIAAGIVVALINHDSGSANGYYYFVLLNCILYSSLILLIVWRSIHEHKKQRQATLHHRYWLFNISVATVFLVAALILVNERWQYAYKGIVASDTESVLPFEGRFFANAISTNNTDQVKAERDKKSQGDRSIGLQPLAENPDQHIVNEGETLWKISEDSYGTGFKWKNILEINKDIIGFLPNGRQALIEAGQVLTVPQNK